MEFLAFRSGKTGNRVIVPASSAMIIERKDSAVVYAIGGNGKDRMVWEIPGLSGLHVCSSVGQALSMTIPTPKATTAVKGEESTTEKKSTTAEKSDNESA